MRITYRWKRFRLGKLIALGDGMKTSDQSEIKYPDCYLHVEECRSGETWIQPIRGNGLLDIKHQVKRWIRREFCGELQLDGKLMPRLQGDYYAKIITDGRPPDSIVVWTSGGFYLKSA